MGQQAAWGIDDLRADVRAGRLRGAALCARIKGLPPTERDPFVDALLALPDLPEDQPGLPPGTVPYLPCAVDTILQVVQEAPVAVTDRSVDRFVDLGAGLGRVALLVQLLCGAPAVGVELQPHLVQIAVQAAASLSLRAVDFHCADATRSPLPDGTVYFIYASFGRSALAQVLAQLKMQAQRQDPAQRQAQADRRDVAGPRRITLCAVDFEIPQADYPWLRPRPSQRPELVFYDACLSPAT